MKRKKMLKNYYITHNTHIIESILHENRLFSRVYDNNGEFIVKQSPLTLVRETCKLMGMSYKGSREISKRFFGNRKHKLPILISQEYGIPCILFPLLSPLSKNNVWVNLNSITNITKDSSINTIITIKDDREVTLNVSHTSFSLQYVDAAMYQKYLLRKRNIIHRDGFSF